MILDANALSAFIDGEPAVGEVLRRQARVAIPVIVMGEFRYGISQSRHGRAYEDWLEANLRRFDVLEVTGDTTHAYASVRAALRRRARQIPANDGWIAAHALEHRLPILSRDEHFDAVESIERRSW